MSKDFMKGEAMNAKISIAAIALIVTACGGSSSTPPTAPSPPTAPTSPTGAVTQWSVTQRFVSVDGPDNCWVREQRERLTGLVFPGLPMSVTRSNGSISIEGSFFQVNYAGSFAGTEFSATGSKPLEGGGRPCRDGSSFQQQPGTSTLSGRFSSDDRVMTASEVNSYRLTSGEVVTYTWDWQAGKN